MSAGNLRIHGKCFSLSLCRVDGRVAISVTPGEERSKGISLKNSPVLRNRSSSKVPIIISKSRAIHVASGCHANPSNLYTSSRPHRSLRRAARIGGSVSRINGDQPSTTVPGKAQDEAIAGGQGGGLDGEAGVQDLEVTLQVVWLGSGCVAVAWHGIQWRSKPSTEHAIRVGSGAGVWWKRAAVS
ncbi:hypothetical protein HYALB_00009676 [Hymenoscyphus albidus]|uniref:Uncharacterized protein n=1 Tax=Hymenoscyphus albidus TaxID=595503 RepID=A0A9N9LGB8_9HELO|nr:hypothetical protein HYALB_00009676 [Hymenoscyphus albidus]